MIITIKALPREGRCFFVDFEMKRIEVRCFVQKRVDEL